MLYVGVDHHTKTSHLTATDESCNIVKRGEIACCFEEVKDFFDGYDEPVKPLLRLIPKKERQGRYSEQAQA